MGMSRCYSLMNCLLIIFNIIFLVVGVGCGGFAAWALYDGRASAEPGGRAGLCALAGWAAALLAGALLALAGAARSSASLLAAAFALLALSGVASGAAAWWGAAHGEALEGALRAQLAVTVRTEYGQSELPTQLLDAIQQGLRCCGAEGPRDWQHSRWAKRDSPHPLDLSVSAPPAFYTVPASCCSPHPEWEGCAGARRVPWGGGGSRAGLHAEGCGTRVLSELHRMARAPLAAGGALLAAQALALLLTLALCLRAQPHVPRYKA